MKPIYLQINRYLDYCASTRGMSPNTIYGKRSVYKRFARVTGCYSLRKMTNFHFDKWVKYELARGASHRSINAYNANILAMVNYYREIGMIIPLKVPLIGKLKEGSVRQNYYTRTQIREVVGYANDATALMIEICFDGGLRIAELTRLRLRNFSGRRINFIGKGNKPREVYISEATERKLYEYIRRRQITDYLWPNRQGDGPITEHGARKRLRKPFKAAGYTDFYPHALRHSFATDLQVRGASVPEIQQMIGHASVATTERYIHALDGHLAELFVKYR